MQKTETPLLQAQEEEKGIVETSSSDLELHVVVIDNVLT